MSFLRIALAALALILSPAYAAKPQIQWNPDFDFSSVSTFRWVEPPEASIEAEDPFLHHHIINAIQYYLTSHGLTDSDLNPDIHVTYRMSNDTDVRLQSTSVGYSFGNYSTRGWGYYGNGMGGPVYTDTRVIEIERGSLMVDIWDEATNELIWRGVADDIHFEGNSAKVRRNVEKAISKMAKQADKLMDSR